ncbi:MAG: ATP-binding cassette domain-containing protein [Armatimonadota bacterium]|nr:MAG: ATP-binding cassette domain-containing protein [Armatimonadota bacterium]
MQADTPTAEPVLSVRDLRFTYRDADRPALDGISFDLCPGDLLVVMGASGAGKSTLCRSLNRIIPHFIKGSFNGQVRLLGQDTSGLRVADCARHVGLVFQDFESQLFATNIELEVAFGAESLGIPRIEIVQRIRDLLSLVGLSHLSGRRPASLSGGEKQRLAIAAALASNPPLLVLDEATSDLDPVGKSAIFRLAAALTASSSHRAIVFAHHDPEEAVGASHVLLLSEGRVAALGPPDQVLADPQLLSYHGVVPLALTSLFDGLGLEDRPLCEENATELLLQRGLRIPDEAAQRWQANDRARAQTYGQPIIEVRGLTHRYAAGDPAVHKADLLLRRGECVAIIGQNGSGKTTLVKHFNGLLRPTEGDVLVSGESTRDRPLNALAQHVGYVFQNPDHQIFAATVAEEVAFAPTNFGLDRDEVASRVAESLAAVGFSGRENDDPFSLTKGERQRVAVASVLAGRPQVLIFDEPTTGLDERESRRMMALINQLNQRGHTIVLITHAMWLAAEYAHRVIVMHQGRILLDAPTRSAFAQTDVLRQAAIIPPQIVRLCRRLGAPALTVPEALEALRPP